jgi:hypothetical protein
MRDHFDDRVLSAQALDFIRACQSSVECHLGGGMGLSRPGHLRNGPQ